jgi:hypothetical protein
MTEEEKQVLAWQHPDNAVPQDEYEIPESTHEDVQSIILNTVGAVILIIWIAAIFSEM